MARHRRPVNVRDDGLLAVLGPLVTVGGVERAVLLDVDSGMVLDAWVCGEAPGGSAPADGAVSGSDGGRVAEPEPGTVSSGSSAWHGDTTPGGGTRPGVGALWRSLLGAERAAGPRVAGGDRDADGGADRDGIDDSYLGPIGGVDGLSSGVGDGRIGHTGGFGGVGHTGGFGGIGHTGGLDGVGRAGGGVAEEAVGADVEAFGARHADLVRALLALPGSPPRELTLVVDDRHHLVRCVADPAGGRLALAVVVAGTPWVVRRVRRHLRQLPDAGLTTGPWLLTWAVGPPPAPRPPADRPPTGHATSEGWPGGGGAPPVEPREDGWPSVEPHPLADGRPPGEVHAIGGAPHLPLSVGRPDGPAPAGVEPRALADGWPPAEPSPDADGPPVALPSPDDASALVTDPAAAVPDPRRGPAPPSALPPARSAGGR